MGQIRTFVAVDVSPGIRNKAWKLIGKLSSESADYNWVEKDNLHVTLNFLGDVEESEIPSVCSLIGRTVRGFGQFELSVQGLGCFPNPEKPRVVWMGIDQGSQELIELNGVLADALEQMRFPRERHDYRPHLTLGRIRRGGRYSPGITKLVEQNQNQSVASTWVEQVVVYSSFLDRSGPTYTAMSRIDLSTN